MVYLGGDNIAVLGLGCLLNLLLLESRLFFFKVTLKVALVIEVHIDALDVLHEVWLLVLLVCRSELRPIDLNRARLRLVLTSSAISLLRL